MRWTFGLFILLGTMVKAFGTSVKCFRHPRHPDSGRSTNTKGNPSLPSQRKLGAQLFPDQNQQEIYSQAHLESWGMTEEGT